MLPSILVTVALLLICVVACSCGSGAVVVNGQMVVVLVVGYRVGTARFPVEVMIQGDENDRTGCSSVLLTAFERKYTEGL